jgi:2-dehydro-3-deoxyphosphogluconate aldolase/(4S)-4-hydroxy-2-oxoglutarate aldolase
MTPGTLSSRRETTHLMTPKNSVLTTIHEQGTVLIVRLEDAAEAERVAHAAVDGGIRVIEITLSIPKALPLIERLADRYAADGVVVGAGTVLDDATAASCISAGARLLVSPQLNRGMLAQASRHQVATLSGAYTPTEIVDSVEAGADLVKLFPAEFGGPAYARTVLAPLAHVPLVPAGGVTEQNVGEWFAAGVAGVGVGSAITKAARPDGDYARVTAAAERFLAAVADARA